MDQEPMSRVVIPAPPPGKVGERLLVAGIFGAMGNINEGLLHAGGHGVALNEQIRVPEVCNCCGAEPVTTHGRMTSEVTFSEVGNILGGSLIGQTKVDFYVPLCKDCVELFKKATVGVSLESYVKSGKDWQVTLLIANRAVAELYAQANPGSTISTLPAAPPALSPDAPGMSLLTVAWRGGFVLKDNPVTVLLDRQPIGSGSFERGFEISCATRAGPHTVRLTFRSADHNFAAREGGSYRIELAWDRMWGKFTMTGAESPRGGEGAAVPSRVGPISPEGPPWSPTHAVPAAGLPAWSAADPTGKPVTTLEAGTELVVDQRADAWALVRIANGWCGWVDGRWLVDKKAAG
jgi:hypothetical protein